MLVEPPRLLCDDELGGCSPLPAPPPLTQRLERVFAAEAAELPAPARTLLVLATANDEDAAAATLGEGRYVDWAMMRLHPKEVG